MLLAALGIVVLLGVAALRGWSRPRLLVAIGGLGAAIVLFHLVAPGAAARGFGGSAGGWAVTVAGIALAVAYLEGVALLRRWSRRAAKDRSAGAEAGNALGNAEAPASGRMTVLAEDGTSAQGEGEGRMTDTDGNADETRLDTEEIERYARHIVLREIGGPGQLKLKRARVLVIGAGGLGSPVLLYLAAAGVGTIGVVDDDEVAVSNLQRQIIHRTEDVGLPKVASAARAMTSLNPHVRVRQHAQRLDAAAARDLFSDYDLVLDGTDNFETRYLVNAAAVAAGIPLVSGAITQWEGQLSVFDPAGGAPCYACVFPEAPAPGLAPSCAEAGVIGALPGVVGAMMAAEAVKVITGAGQALRGEMLIYDALWGESRKITLSRRPGCAVCGGGADAG